MTQIVRLSLISLGITASLGATVVSSTTRFSESIRVEDLDGTQAQSASASYAAQFVFPVYTPPEDWSNLERIEVEFSDFSVSYDLFANAVDEGADFQINSVSLALEIEGSLWSQRNEPFFTANTERITFGDSEFATVNSSDTFPTLTGGGPQIQTVDSAFYTDRYFLTDTLGGSPGTPAANNLEARFGVEATVGFYDTRSLPGESGLGLSLGGARMDAEFEGTITLNYYYTDEPYPGAGNTPIELNPSLANNPGPAVPEPSTYAAIAGLITLGVTVIRKQRRS
ncbi:MAG: PEP-CTERM sorting domain-containing protein [Opitutales bacterium]